MSMIGRILKSGIKLRKRVVLERRPPLVMQHRQLRRLLFKARQTQFGRQFHFSEVLRHVDHPEALYEAFRTRVPIYNYNRIYRDWWHRARTGEKDVCWPGKVRYFALSSGTSEAATKHIPVTEEMTRAMQRIGTRQLLTLSHYDLPPKIFGKAILMLGGSTSLKFHKTYFEGDLSGIQASKIPKWFQFVYKPGRRIARNPDWNAKLDEITRKAKDWDVAAVVGVPAWVQLLMEKIIAHYQVETIHDIWPNLTIFTHGGVAFEPYRKGFEKLLARPLVYIETYLASEGFIAYQARPNRRSMRLVLDQGIFLEFIPFNRENFDEDGELVADPQTLMVHQIEEDKDYALLLSTCAGTWRYLIGDVVRLVDRAEMEIIITGRTKHFLSLCGEHLSVDNMNKAIELVADELNVRIKEFTVAGVPHDTLFAHHWYVGTDDPVDQPLMERRIDEVLKGLNDDYRVERSAALKEMSLRVLPTRVFYAWLEARGKVGGQHKFPRVLKQGRITEWEAFVHEQMPQ